MDIREWAENLSRGVVLPRRLPSEFGRIPIHTTPEAGLGYWSAMSRVDPLLYSMAKEIVKPASIVWDVGSNVGLFAFCAAARSGQTGSVLAIEPDVWLASLIHRSARRLDTYKYKSAHVEVLCASISDTNRISELSIAQGARTSNYISGALGSSQAKGVRYGQPTITVTLDFILQFYPAPSVLKIDVETHETGVLKGAERLLNEFRPTIWCEVASQNSDTVTKLLHAANYKLYGAETQPHPAIESAWFNTLAIPL